MSLSVSVTEPASMIISLTPNNVSCNGANDGSIVVAVSAGTPAYIYQWNDAVNKQNRNNLSPGNYSVTVTDANSCSLSSSTAITEPAALSLQPSVNEPSCASLPNDGVISITANGGTPSYAFVWSNGKS